MHVLPCFCWYFVYIFYLALIWCILLLFFCYIWNAFNEKIFALATGLSSWSIVFRQTFVIEICWNTSSCWTWSFWCFYTISMQLISALWCCSFPLVAFLLFCDLSQKMCDLVITIIACNCWMRTPLPGNAERQWLLLTVSHIVLHCVKRSVSEKKHALLHQTCTFLWLLS